MSFLSDLWGTMSEDRFAANLIAAHAVVVVLVLVSLVLRRLLSHGGNRLSRWTNGHWLDPLGRQVTHHARNLLFWLTLGAVGLSTLAGLVYHVMGRDARADMTAWWAHWTFEDLLRIGLMASGVLATGLVTWFITGTIRRLRPVLERRVITTLGAECKEEAVHRWFHLLERFAVSSCGLVALWTAGQIVGLERLADHIIGFVLRLSAIVVVARLAILAFPAVARVVTELGGRHLGKGRFHNYWERVMRLFPLGERCFEAAVILSAASMILGELLFIRIVAHLGPQVVECIGIFFVTRVLIELSQVLLNEAFGMYREDRQSDPKGRTLVPLLQSLCQYTLYFGSVIIMLSKLGIDTGPLLAGAGILGLGVGLGAQSLVTDVVSGFFILFENQYLVGDFVEIGAASGTVEEVGIRVTQIRDSYGKLHIIPNGQIKGVINYSKGYVNAVVDLALPRGTDLETIFYAMTEAGRRLRQAHQEVLDDTEVQGLVDLGTAEMKVRAVTKVQPGSHGRMQNEYRRLLKLVLDQNVGPERLSRAA